MGTVAFKPLTTAEQIFKSVIWDPMIKAGEVWLAGAEASVPFLNLPIVQELEDHEIEAVADWAFRNLVLAVDVESIALVSPERQSAYASASEALKLIAMEQGTDSNAFKKAEADAIDAQRKFTSFIGQ